MARFTLETELGHQSFRLVHADDQEEQYFLADMYLSAGLKTETSTQPDGAIDFFNRVFRSPNGQPDIVITDRMFDKGPGAWDLDLEYLLDLADDLGIPALRRRIAEFTALQSIEPLLEGNGINYAIWLRILGYQGKIVLNTSMIPKYSKIAAYAADYEPLFHFNKNEVIDAVSDKTGQYYAVETIDSPDGSETDWNLISNKSSIIQLLPTIVKNLLLNKAA